MGSREGCRERQLALPAPCPNIEADIWQLPANVAGDGSSPWVSAHPHGRPKLSAGLLAMAWMAVVCTVWSEPADRSFSFSNKDE